MSFSDYPFSIVHENMHAFETKQKLPIDAEKMIVSWVYVHRGLAPVSRTKLRRTKVSAFQLKAENG